VSPSVRRVLPLVIGLAISVVALYVLVSSIDLEATRSALGRVHVERLLPIALVIAVQFSLRALRWSRLAASLRPEAPVPAGRFMIPLAIGYLGNAILPARLGEAVRAAVLGRREELPIAAVLGTVLVERVVDTLTLAALAGIVAAFIAPEWMARLAAVIALIGIIGLVVLLVGGRWFAARLARATHGVWHTVATVGRGAALTIANAIAGIPRAALALAVGISLAAWALDATLFWLVSWSLDLGLSFAQAFLVGAVTVLGTAVPSAPGYVGTFEAAAVAAAVAFGVRSSDALAFAALAHVTSTLPVALIGAILVVRLGGGAGFREAATQGAAARSATASARAPRS
jgi:glycosyltransferase 2 family protein